MKKRPKPVDPVKPDKAGNLLGEVPMDVAYAGCSHQDCLFECDLATGHCERLEQAFIRAGYARSLNSERAMGFKIRINGEKRARALNVKTTVYRDAAAAVPAIFGKSLPIDVEIWSPDLIPEYGPYRYRIRNNDFGGLVVETLTTRT
jgi:hypothetical protein